MTPLFAIATLAAFFVGWAVRGFVPTAADRMVGTIVTYGRWHVERECKACRHAFDYNNGLCPNCGETEYGLPKIGRVVISVTPGKPPVERWEWKS